MFIRSRCVLGVTAKDGTCPIYPGCTAEVDDLEGKRAVESGYAVEIAAGAAGAAVRTAPGANLGENSSEGGNAQNGPSDGSGEVVDLEAMTYTELKAYAQELGINTGKLKSKTAMIEAITSVMPGLPADDELPELTAQEVIEE